MPGQADTFTIGALEIEAAMAIVSSVAAFFIAMWIRVSGKTLIIWLPE